jgi:hypothetical protein
MVQSTSNINGGLWQATSVSEVHFCLAFDFVSSIYTLTILFYFKSYNQPLANNQQVAVAANAQPGIGIADAMRQTTLTQCFNAAAAPPPAFNFLT